MADDSSNSASSSMNLTSLSGGVGLQPLPLVKAVCEKRQDQFSYLKRIHRGGVHFFNTVKISQTDLVANYPNSKMRKRSAEWFYLGISLAPLLQIDQAIDYIKSLALLMEEYEYEVSDYARQKMRQIFRKTKEENDLYSPNPSYQETGLYTHLQTPNLPFELDYLQVFFSLCDIASAVYSRIFVLSEKHLSNNPDVAFTEAVLKLDSRFKKIIAAVTKEINAIASDIIRNEITLVDPLFKQVEKQWAASAAADDAGDGNNSD